LKRIQDSELSESYKIYAKFRVTRDFPDSESNIAIILSYEQLTTRTDLLFTAVRISADIISRVQDFNPAIVNYAQDILHQFAVPIWQDVIKTNEHGHCELTLSDQLKMAVSRAVHYSLRDSWLSTNQRSYDDFLSAGLAAMLSYSGSEADEEQLKKHTLNFHWMPNALVLNIFSQLRKIPEIYIGLRKSPQSYIPNVLLKACEESILLTLEMSTIFGEQLLYSNLHRNNNLLADIVMENDLPIWDRQQMSATVADCLAIDAAQAAFQEGNFDCAIRVAAHAMLRNARLAKALPFDNLFFSANWRVIESYGLTVELCICLHYYLLINDQRQIRTFKRFAVEELMLRSNQVNFESYCKNLIASGLNKTIAESFMTEVCDLPILELLPGVDGSRDALKLRACILRIAANISDTSRAQWIAEADDIDAQLEVDGVLDTLDESKVYVDEEPLLTSAIRELSGDFERYIRLSSEGTSQTISFEELEKSLRQQSAAAFQIPENEINNLLVQMLISLLDMFINDPVNGLDSVIGRRIRHGTISSELRGSLEHLKLIGQRPRSGADYDLPSGVLQYIDKYDPRVKKAISSAFARFSQSIDGLVVQLRDEVFQCKPKGRLKPAFELSINPFIFTMASNIAGKARSVDVFSRECFQIFWFNLSQIVERERPLVASYIKKALRDSFSKLINDIRNTGVNDPSFLAALQSASEQLQHKAIVVASWIRTPRVSYESRTYPLDLVFDVTMAFVKSQRLGFEPQVNANIESDIHLDAHSFPIVHDALQIALDNIAYHSGILHGNKIVAHIRLNDEKNKLCFTIVSDIAKDLWIKERGIRLEAIKDDIAQRSFVDRAMRPSGSGLAKLASIVHQREFCELDFGPINNNQQFKLYFELMYISEQEEKTVENDRLSIKSGEPD
jgi:hypothetical protein